MKYLLLLPFIVISLFITSRAFAQSSIQPIPTFFCVGTDLRAPCATIAPNRPTIIVLPNSPVPLKTPIVVPNTPAPLPTSTNISPTPSTSPCSTTLQSVPGTTKTQSTTKIHASGKPGFLQKLITLLLQLLELLFKELGIPFPSITTPPPCPTPSPSISPAPSLPTSNISPTTNVKPSKAPTPTLFGASPSPSNCQLNAILENPCHPLIGSYSDGYPNIAGGTSASVAQTQAAEQRAKRTFSVVHTSYHQGAGGDKLTPEEIYFATNTNQTVFLNWWPTRNWKDGDGGNAAVNSEIDTMAASVKSVPHKIAITIQHEPNDKVSALDSPNDSTCPSNVRLPGSSGTPAQYRAMWVNVENRFKADGVKNVVWAILFESFNQKNDNAFPNCLDQALYPGNQYIDWIGYDTYGNTTATDSFQETAGLTYQYMQQLSSTPNLSTYGMMSKPIVLGEFNACSDRTDQQRVQYFQNAQYTLDHNLYPDIKMYLMFDAAGTGNTPPGGCMLGYEHNKSTVPGNVVQNAFNAFANDSNFAK